MKAEISKGDLFITPKNNIEEDVLTEWFEKYYNGCTGIVTTKSIYQKPLPKITLFKRIKFKIQLFLYR